MKQSLKYLAVFIVWNLGLSVLLLLALQAEPGTGAAWGWAAGTLLFAYLFFYLYLLRGGRGDRAARETALRIRPLRGGALRWTLIAIPVLLLLSWSLGEVYLRLVPVPPGSLDPFAFLFSERVGRLMLAILAIAIAPLMEEFFFRGLIQSALESRYGGLAGVLGGAGFFALVHFLPWIFPLHFLLGAAFGFAVWATRSIWAGVILHAANNCIALVSQPSASGEIPAQPVIWDTGLDLGFGYALGGLLVSLALAGWVGRRLLSEGRAYNEPPTAQPVV